MISISGPCRYFDLYLPSLPRIFNSLDNSLGGWKYSKGVRGEQGTKIIWLLALSLNH